MPDGGREKVEARVTRGPLCIVLDLTAPSRPSKRRAELTPESLVQLYHTQDRGSYVYGSLFFVGNPFFLLLD